MQKIANLWKLVSLLLTLLIVGLTAFAGPLLTTWAHQDSTKKANASSQQQFATILKGFCHAFQTDLQASPQSLTSDELNQIYQGSSVKQILMNDKKFSKSKVSSFEKKEISQANTDFTNDSGLYQSDACGIPGRTLATDESTFQSYFTSSQYKKLGTSAIDSMFTNAVRANVSPGNSKGNGGVSQSDFTTILKGFCQAFYADLQHANTYDPKVQDLTSTDLQSIVQGSTTVKAIIEKENSSDTDDDVEQFERNEIVTANTDFTSNPNTYNPESCQVSRDNDAKTKFQKYIDSNEYMRLSVDAIDGMFTAAVQATQGSQGSSSSSSTTDPSKSSDYETFREIVLGFCQQFQTDVYNRLQQNHAGDLDWIKHHNQSVSQVFVNDFKDGDPFGQKFTSKSDVIAFERVEISDRAGDFDTTYEPSGSNCAGASSLSASDAKSKFDKFDYKDLLGDSVDSLVTDTVRADPNTPPSVQ